MPATVIVSAEALSALTTPSTPAFGELGVGMRSTRVATLPLPDG